MAEKGRYTKYTNKIGLYSNSKGSFVKNDTSVVLSFPFKDAVLEAGMSKEDVGREERFLHLELDSKDIDTLEEPKVLTDFSFVDKEGEMPLTATSDIDFFDSEGNLKQNLLIKGNNLLALYTLSERLAGQVKLIYIDPPYNTGNDGFRYNDSFNHSAWLAFMKNRLEVAKELLSDDGCIWVTLDDNEYAYLRVLMDEVFGRNNFKATFVWQHRKSSQNDIDVSLSHNYNVCFAKDTTKFRLNPLGFDDTNFANPDNDPRGDWVADPFDAPAIRPNLEYPIINPITGEQYLPPSGRHWRFSKEKYENALADNRVIWGKTGKSRPQLKRFLSEAQDKGKTPFTVWTDLDTATNATKHLMKVFESKDVFSTSKPESLIERIIHLGSDEGDIVLDYHLGSGTTSAVAHKMNRRWVGIEQMDYIETVAKERLKSVVAGEQGGISKAVDWQGGGSFVCFELKKYNQEYIERIMKATSLSELEDLYVDMRNNAFLKFWFDRHAFEKDEDFRKLDLDSRKKALVEVLDENQLYLNYADMDDTRHNVTPDEKTLTDKFYGTAEN